MLFAKRILRDRTGNFGIMTALLLVPLVGVVGFAIDFGDALVLKNQLQTAADAAAIGAITLKSAAFAQAISQSGDGQFTLDNTEALGIFNSQSSSDMSNIPKNVSIILTKQASVLTSTVKFYASMPTTLLGIIGQSSISVGGNATATYQTPPFLDIYMLLDNSPSMGIGATTADIALMKKATQYASPRANCAFACHMVSSAGVEAAGDYYHLDKNAGATLRIDVVAQAISDIVQKTAASELVPDQIRMSAYSFGQAATNPAPPIYTLASQMTDLTAFAAATQNLKLMTVPSIDFAYGESNYVQALASVNSKITSVGNGISAANRQPVVIFVGDGLGDHQNQASCMGNYALGRCWETIQASSCNQIKQRGITVAVLYTTYLPLPEDSGYVQQVQPIQGNMLTQMQACASPGYFIQVDPSHSIGDGMDALFGRILAAPILTQ